MVSVAINSQKRGRPSAGPGIAKMVVQVFGRVRIMKVS